MPLTPGMVSSNFIGVQHLHVAKMLTDVAGENPATTYETPVDMGKVLISVKIQPKNSEAQLYADNQSIEASNVISEYTLTFDTAALPLEYKAYLLGHRVDDGVMTVSSKDSAPYFGIAFQSDKANGTARFVKFLKVKFNEPEESSSTKNENIEYQTPTMTATAIYRISDGLAAKYADEESAGADSEAITNWYTAM